MTKKEKFVNFVESNLFNQINFNDIDEDIISYWTVLKNIEEKEKPLFTENGKLILTYIQNHPEVQYWKSKDVAEGLFISTKTVAGSMRKLVNDGFIEKVGQDPIIYIITENGKNINIENEGE